MGTWLNSDGLHVKFGVDEGDLRRGGELNTLGQDRVIQATVKYTDALSATAAIVGSAVTTDDGAFGVVIPKGFRVKAIEVLTKTAFTSSGTIGSATLAMGLKLASDRSTELDHDGFTTASFVGSRIDAVGERTFVEIGTTGVGALVGTTLASNGVLVVANTAHGSHPYTAGELQVNIIGYDP